MIEGSRTKLIENILEQTGDINKRYIQKTEEDVIKEYLQLSGKDYKIDDYLEKNSYEYLLSNTKPITRKAVEISDFRNRKRLVTESKY